MSYRDCLACKEVGTKPKHGEGVTIEYNPGIQMPGTPTIKGHRLAADHIAIRAYKFGIKDVMEDFVLSREEVLVACWWAGLWGPRRTRKWLGEWAKESGRHLWYGCIQIPDPPRETQEPPRV